MSNKNIDSNFQMDIKNSKFKKNRKISIKKEH